MEEQTKSRRVVPLPLPLDIPTLRQAYEAAG